MTLQVPVEDQVFQLCKRLDFNRNKTDLINFHKNQLANIGSARLKGPLRSPCDTDHPYDLYDVIEANNIVGEVADINRACGQLRLGKLVQELAPNNTRNAINQTLADLATADLATTKSKNLLQAAKDRRMKKFKA